MAGSNDSDAAAEPSASAANEPASFDAAPASFQEAPSAFQDSSSNADGGSNQVPESSSQGPTGSSIGPDSATYTGEPATFNNESATYNGDSATYNNEPAPYTGESSTYGTDSSQDQIRDGGGSESDPNLPSSLSVSSSLPASLSASSPFPAVIAPQGISPAPYPPQNMALSQPSPGPQAVPVTNVISPYQHFPGSSPDQYPSLFQQYQPWNSHVGGAFGMPPLLPGAPQQFPPSSPQQFSPAPPQFPPASPQRFAPPSPQFPPGSAQQFPPASLHQFPPASPQFPQGSAQQFPPQQFPPQQFPPQQMFGMGFARGPPGQFSPSPNFSPPTMPAQNVPPGLGAQAMSPLMGPPSGFGPHNIPRNVREEQVATLVLSPLPSSSPSSCPCYPPLLPCPLAFGCDRIPYPPVISTTAGDRGAAGYPLPLLWPGEFSGASNLQVNFQVHHTISSHLRVPTYLLSPCLCLSQVVDCRICGDPNSVLRFAFVEFTDEEGAKNALSIAGTMLGYYPLRVLPSKTAILPVNPTYLPKSQEEREMCARTVYCTNIDKKVTQADVKLFFESLCGEISRLRLLGDYHHSTRIAFVEFVMAESAMAALNCSGAILGSLPIRSVPHLPAPPCTSPHLPAPLCATLYCSTPLCTPLPG
ncbi:unnamed protein product [Closterium sp. Yama58-4]|nr:unnamed protein product [Closterium sp. Yama58-4]